ncbi:MAG TPA: hypothetical protein VGQ17_16815 [Gemmatimonadales bacterium]|nr:hypothetical protein [Gemmatimonadales bacterium]
MRMVLALAGALLTAGCGSPLRGTYADPDGATRFKFESGGKAYVSMLGMEREFKFEVEGKRVKLITPQGTEILTIQDDGSLKGPLGLTLTKRP